MKGSIKNILIGLFVSGAILILVSMILFLDPKVGDGKKILQVRFANIAGINDGTRVTYAGKPVGEVVAIHEIANARNAQVDEMGRIYCYLLTLKLDSSVAVYDTDEISIRSTGLMGEKSIAILPKASLPGKGTARLIQDEIITANSIDPLENTFNQVAKTANRMDATLSEFNQWFKQNQQPLSDTLTSLHQALYRFDGTLAQRIASGGAAATGGRGEVVGGGREERFGRRRDWRRSGVYSQSRYICKMKPWFRSGATAWRSGSRSRSRSKPA